MFFFSSVLNFVFFCFFFSIWLSFVFEGKIFLDERGYLNIPVAIGFLVAVVVVVSILTYIWAKLSYHFYKYELTELGFRKESGVIWKKYVTIPYARIQNVDINRGIIARLLGLSDLHIQTAGASANISRYGFSGINAEGRLPGVSRVDAEVLRDELVKRASRLQTQGV